jgi:hypothetical protein
MIDEWDYRYRIGVLIGFTLTLSCLGYEPARGSSSQNHLTWTANLMSQKASLISNAEAESGSGPTWTWDLEFGAADPCLDRLAQKGHYCSGRARDTE